jgi:phage terminase small subunit
LQDIPSPSYQLNETELAYFAEAAELLIMAGTLTAADVPGMTRAASWFGIWKRCLAEIEVTGIWQTTKSGYTAKSAPFQAGMDAEKSLTSWEKSVGLNISGRAKLPPPPPVKEHNPFDDL